MSPLRGGRYYAGIVAGRNLETSMSDPLSRVITRMAPTTCHASLGMLRIASPYAGYRRRRGDGLERERIRAPIPIAGARPQTTLRGYGHPSPARPRQCRGQQIPNIAATSFVRVAPISPQPEPSLFWHPEVRARGPAFCHR